MKNQAEAKFRVWRKVPTGCGKRPAGRARQGLRLCSFELWSKLAARL